MSYKDSKKQSPLMSKQIRKWAVGLLAVLVAGGGGYAIKAFTRSNSDDRIETNTTNIVAGDSSTVNNKKQGDISGGTVIQGDGNGDVVGRDKFEFHQAPKEQKENPKTEYKIENPQFHGPTIVGPNGKIEINQVKPLPRQLNADDKRRLDQVDEGSHVMFYYEYGKEVENFMEEICQYLDQKNCTYQYFGTQNMSGVDLRGAEPNERFEIGKSDIKNFVIELKRQ